GSSRGVKAVHGRTEGTADPEFGLGLSNYLSATSSREALLDLLPRFEVGDAPLDVCLRRTIWRAIARRFGDGVRIGSHVGFRHLETFEIGNGVFIDAHAYLQGRLDGHFV